jgi:SNF2 family DNA or RNA helicase
LNGVKEVISHDPNVNDIDLLVNSSGKLVLLDKLLPRLKLDGHRILLFSQFKNMLNIIQEYLELRGFKYERIDGNISGQKRQAAIDRFQSKNQVSSGSEPPLIMLISTRAGGVGINLTAADTCVSFISD